MAHLQERPKRTRSASDAPDAWGVTYDNPRQHSISLMCDDLVGTMADLEARGAQFMRPVEKQDYGFTVMLKVPGADDVMLYEPRHPIAHSL